MPLLIYYAYRRIQKRDEEDFAAERIHTSIFLYYQLTRVISYIKPSKYDDADDFGKGGGLEDEGFVGFVCGK